MPRTARILQFRSPTSCRVELSPAEASSGAATYLNTPLSERANQFVDDCLSNPEVFLAVCKALHDELESSPGRVEEEASFLYQWVTKNQTRCGLFDEHEYFLGEVAHTAAVACRFLGKRTEAARWLD